MNDLLRADFYSLLKSKLTYILLGISVGLPIFMIMLYVAINKIFTSDLTEDAAAMGMGVSVFTGRVVMFGNFSLTNNIGLIIPIFAAIFTLSDIRQGTIRNKIIFGFSRVEVYFSHLIVSVVMCVIASLISFAVLAAGSAAFFEYGVEFDKAEAYNFIRCLITGILLFVYVASLSTFLSLVTKSMPLTITFTLLISVGLGLIGSLSGFITNETYQKLFYILPTYASTVVATGGEITTEIFLFGLFSFLFFIAANTVVGIVLFKKNDLK